MHWASINTASNAVFAPWFDLLAGLPYLAQIAITALPVTVFALLVFRYTSSQEGIRSAKNRIKGYLLELWLYKDSPGVLLRAQGQVLLSSLEYLGYSLVPMAVMLVPLALLMIQLESRFAWRALQPGESVIVALDAAPRAPAGSAVTLAVSDGLTAETPPLRLRATEETLWRVRTDEPGVHRIDIKAGSGHIVRTLFSGTRFEALSPAVYRADDWRVLAHPAETPLPADSAVRAVKIDYPRSRGEFLGLSSASWMLLGFTLLMGFALRGFFNVTF